MPTIGGGGLVVLAFALLVASALAEVAVVVLAAIARARGDVALARAVAWLAPLCAGPSLFLNAVAALQGARPELFGWMGLGIGALAVVALTLAAGVGQPPARCWRRRVLWGVAATWAVLAVARLVNLYRREQAMEAYLARQTLETRRGSEASLWEELTTIRGAIARFRADRGRYPRTLDELVAGRYLEARPFDPIAWSIESWVLVREEGKAPGEAGIVDVRSGAPGPALDGSAYRDW